MQPNAPVTAVDAMFVALEHALVSRQKVVEQLAELTPALDGLQRALDESRRSSPASDPPAVSESHQPSAENAKATLATLEGYIALLGTELTHLDAVLTREFPGIERVFLEAYGHQLSLYWAAGAIVQLAATPPTSPQPTETIQ